VVEGLARGMRENKDLRVLLAAGYYDQATPMFGAELSLAEPGVPMDRVETTYYPAGHMMYLDKGSLKKLSDDLHAFVK
jgi:carboxypeptidase C (cathepsin A)